MTARRKPSASRKPPIGQALPASTGYASEGQTWIAEHLISLRPWLRKATWEDICNKLRDHSPDVYSALDERGKTHIDSSSATGSP